MCFSELFTFQIFQYCNPLLMISLISPAVTVSYSAQAGTMFASTTMGFCRPVVFRGEALSWPAKPSGQYALGAVSGGIADGVEVAAVAATVGGRRDLHALRVGRVALGEYLVTLTVGNGQ